MEPLLKWAGGKRKFIPQILSVTGSTFTRYYEPFLGGGALLLNITAKEYYCSDINGELINFYNIVKNNPRELYDELKTNFLPNHSKKFYLKIRNLDRNTDEFKKIGDVQKAARFFYLNKTCFNGIWRVNRLGQNNVPFNKINKAPTISWKSFKEISDFFKINNISFRNVDYRKCIKDIGSGDFVYFDPPYDVEVGQSSFVAYTKSGFNQKDQAKLKKFCDVLIQKGALVAISNSDTKFIRKLYTDSEYITYEIHNKIISNRTIAASSKARKPVVELLIIGRKK